MNQEAATYKDGPNVSKHKVDGVAFSRYSSIEGILIPLIRAPIDQGEARSQHERYRLQDLWACRVLDRLVLGHEALCSWN